MLCLSHNAVIRGADDVRDYFRRALEVTRAYHERIVADARAGKPAEEIAAALGAEVYQKTQLMPPDFFVKNCGLLVKTIAQARGHRLTKGSARLRGVDCLTATQRKLPADRLELTKKPAGSFRRAARWEGSRIGHSSPALAGGC